MDAILKNKFATLVKREYIDHRNGFFVVPAILGGLMLVFVVIAMIGVGQLPFENITDGQFDNLPDLLESEAMQAQAEGVDLKGSVDSIVAALYMIMSQFTLAALPFVIFFSLLGSLYEERRDKSILFWKSMPVSDWQEVLSKFFASLVLATVIAFGVMFVTMFAIAILISIYALLLGLPVSLLWPVDAMISIWFGLLVFQFANLLWLLPLWGWLMLVSAGAPRMPFVFAVLPPVVAGIVEALFFHNTHVFEWIGSRFIGASQKIAERVVGNEPSDFAEAMVFVREQVSSTTALQAIADSFADPQFWVGAAMAAAFLWGAVELRKRANT